jgi:hypothetical protein
MSDEQQTDTTETTDETTETGASNTPDRLPNDHPLVKSLEQWKTEAKTLRDKVRTFEDANKTEHERLTEQLEAERTAARTNAVEAARLRAAMAHGLSAEDLDLLGDDPEQIEARAERLAARFAAAQPTTPSKRPTEALKPGASGQSGDPFEPSALADSIWNKNRL